MKLLITGAFGNVGPSVLDEAFKRGHDVTVFDVKNIRSMKYKRRYKKRVKKFILSDLRNREHVENAIQDKDAVIHLAGIIPPLSEENTDLCNSVNVESTEYIVNSIKKHGNNTALVFISSCSVMGHTQNKKPPVRIEDKVHPVDNYTESKVRAETLIRQSGLNMYCITRLGAVMPTTGFYNMKMMTYGFEFPYESRLEIILDKDVATALINAVELFVQEPKRVNKKIFFLGGGESCQLYYGNFFNTLLSSLGIMKAGRDCFAKNKPSFLDWLETKNAQDILQFQNHSFKDYIFLLKKQMRWILPLLALFGRLIGKILMKKSPYYFKEKGFSGKQQLENQNI